MRKEICDTCGKEIVLWLAGAAWISVLRPPHGEKKALDLSFCSIDCALIGLREIKDAE